MRTNRLFIRTLSKSPHWGLRCSSWLWLLFTFSFSLFTLSSCSQDDNPVATDGDRVAVQFATGNLATPKSAALRSASGATYRDYVADDGFETRAFIIKNEKLRMKNGGLKTTSDGSEWMLNDKIGIFMKTAGQPLANGNISEGADNIGYKAAPKGDAKVADFTSVNTAETIYFPVSGNVDFIAYYPYKTPLTSYEYPVDVSTQTTPADIDILYSDNAKNKDKNSGAIDLQFNHALSKLAFTLQTGTGSPNLSGATLSISKIATTGKIDLADGAVSTNNSNQTLTTNGLAAIVIPQTANSSVLTVTLADGVNKFDWTFTTPAWEAGKKYDYTITVNKTGITVTTGNITDWDTNPHNPEEVVVEAVRIPKGVFRMGSPTDEPNRNGGTNNNVSDEIQHNVELSKDYYMSKYQVTNAQYAAFLNAKGVQGETLSHPYGYGNITGGKYGDQVLIYDGQGYGEWGVKWDSGSNKWIPQPGRDDYPVVWVTWFGAEEYAKWVGGSLPTEAQWERACRGSTITAWATATGIESELKDYAWYSVYDTDDGYLSGTKPVGKKKANLYGLYDMHGNVFEWCSDWYDRKYGLSDTDLAGTATDPKGLENTGSNRVLRGGSYDSSVTACRSAYRVILSPANVFNYYGFRVVFVP